MENIQIIHICVEVVIIILIGVFVYFQLKNIKDGKTKLEEEVKENTKRIDNVENYIEKMLGNMQKQNEAIERLLTNPIHHRTNKHRQPPPQQRSTHKNKKQQKTVVPEEIEDDGETSEMLDIKLQQELKDLEIEHPIPTQNIVREETTVFVSAVNPRQTTTDNTKREIVEIVDDEEGEDDETELEN